MSKQATTKKQRTLADAAKELGISAAVGQGGRGLGGAYSTYAGYKRYKEGDKVGGGLQMAGGTANMAAAYEAYQAAQAGQAAYQAALAQGASEAAAQEAGRQATTSATSGYAGYVGPALAIASGGYNAYRGATNKNLSGSQQGEAANAAIRSAVANYYTFGLSGLAEAYANNQWGGTMSKLNETDSKYNPGTQMIKRWMGGKSEAQSARDNARKMAERAGIIDPNSNRNLITFQNGQTFEIGRDGGARLVNEKGEKRQYFDVDLNNPNAVRTAGYADALTAVLSGGASQNEQMLANKKYGRGVVGMQQLGGGLTNAAMSQKDPESAMRELYRKSGIDYKTGRKQIANLELNRAFDADKAINKQKADSARNALMELYHQGAYAKTKGALAQSEYDYVKQPESTVIPKPRIDTTPKKREPRRVPRERREVLLSELIPDEITY